MSNIKRLKDKDENYIYPVTHASAVFDSEGNTIEVKLDEVKQIYVDVEGTYISTDSSSDYLKDVEILGNTVQDASNLADIRSVGDKVEGQDLYKIDVVSCGKNLFGGNFIKGFIGTTGILDSNATDKDFRGDKYILCKPNTNYKGAYYTEDKRITSLVLHFFDKDYKKISFKSGYEDTLSPENAKYIMPSFYSNNPVVKGIVITENENTPNQYEPYIEDKLTILSPVQLEKVGDVADRIICKDGVWGVEKNIVDVDMSKLSYSFSVAPGEWVIGGVKYGGSSRIYNFALDNSYYNFSNKGIVNANLYLTNISPLYNGDNEEGRKVNKIGLKSDGCYIRIEDSIAGSTTEEFNTWIKSANIKLKLATTQPQFIPLPHDQQVKLCTFANKTNISFGCEIEGTIKAQVPKSLGATVNTHTEQINNLNKELDRVKKLEESTVSTVTTESGFTTVEETSNGYFEDMKLEGKTLIVNSDNEIVEAGTEGAILKSVGDGVDEISVVSTDDGNMWDGVLEYGSLGAYTGVEATSTNHNRSKNYIYVIEDLDYYVNIGNTSELEKKIRLIFYKYEGEYHSYMDVTMSKVIKIPKGVSCMRFVYQSSEKIYNISITKGSEPKEYQPSNQDKKPLLYYNPTTETWEKPILRQWDSIEKHSDGKYYYHKRSDEVVIDGTNTITSDMTSDSTIRFQIKGVDLPRNTWSPNGICDKFNLMVGTHVDAEYYGLNGYANGIFINILKTKLSTQDTAGFKTWLQANPVTVVYQLAQEEVYECTNIDLITYENETNYIVNTGVISPKSTLKVHSNISNVVKILQEKVSLLESNVKASQKVQDMMILETDLRMLDIELALMEHMPITLNLTENAMLRSVTYFNFLKNHIINETYEKEYLENVMNKYLATGRINQDEYDELYKMLYPPVYDIELPIEY